jgi:hypothetical protein
MGSEFYGALIPIVCESYILSLLFLIHYSLQVQCTIGYTLLVFGSEWVICVAFLALLCVTGDVECLSIIFVQWGAVPQSDGKIRL